MLEFEIIPENCLRNKEIEFWLGMPVNQVIQSLQNVARLITNIEISHLPKVILFLGSIFIGLKNWIK